ncbi:MAG: hypothetical protein ABF661_08155 [Oenococcus sp.]|uniref:hypothetical protein n=1 Tax=Oenococcus sp. TaxID=1979414 RepID=UPI0039EAC4EC
MANKSTSTKKVSGNIPDDISNGLTNFNLQDQHAFVNQLAPLFYKHNFGTASKTQIDSLMFHFYINNLYNNNKKNGIIDYSKINDYAISQDLGITQARVRTLKIKDRLMFPPTDKIDWKAVLPNLLKTAVYEKELGKFRIFMPDPNIQIEIENYLESHQEFSEPQLGGKILQIRPDFFLKLNIGMAQLLNDKGKSVGRLKEEEIFNFFADKEKLNTNADNKIKERITKLTTTPLDKMAQLTEKTLTIVSQCLSIGSALRPDSFIVKMITDIISKVVSSS